MDQPVFDELPDDPCHLIAIDLDDCAFDLDLRHAANLSNETVRSLARLQATGGRYTRSTRSCGPLQPFVLVLARHPVGQPAIHPSWTIPLNSAS